MQLYVEGNSLQADGSHRTEVRVCHNADQSTDASSCRCISLCSCSSLGADDAVLAQLDLPSLLDCCWSSCAVAQDPAVLSAPFLDLFS